MANDEANQEVPEVEGAFTSLLKKFGVGLKGGIAAETIAENISRTGGEYVFETPERLAERLSTWHEHISPVKRRQILEQWFAEKNIEIPEEALKAASVKTSDIRKGEEEEKKRKQEEEKRKAKFFVDTETGMIRAAKEGETALTWDEAEKVADRIKKEKPKDDKGEKEPAFIPDAEGRWTLNPKAKMGFVEFTVFQMYQDSLKKGEPIDPVDELARREESSVRLKEAMGVKPGGQDTEMAMLDKLDKLGMLKKPGEEGRTTEIEMLDKLNQLGMLKKTGEGEGSETIRALQTQVKELMESLRKQEMDTVKNAVVSLSNQMTELRKDVADKGQLEGRFALMGQAIKSIDSQFTGIRSDARPLLDSLAHGGGKEPAKKSPEEKAKLAKGLKEAVVLEKRARELEDELLFGGKPQS